ncbi:MAG: HAMP domain-containing histidine kinase, partial [Lachnospiraceae bacterium]|nr:HAMP domain-containing histidine kinase [Lachnospiraceae bacterium]
GCAAFRQWLLPDSDAVYLTIEKTLSDGNVITGTYLLEYGANRFSMPDLITQNDNGLSAEKTDSTKYSIKKIETSVDSLTPKRKIAYKICGATMFVAPTILAFTAILLCSIYFYRKKLKQPLDLLADAAKQITGQNLDFEITYNCGDEMGDLCRSFENMRTALYENNKAMWIMLEERRLLQASVAHDLRNPIAIIKGYTEYLEENLKNDEMRSEKTTRIVGNLGAAAKRLEQYTESVRLLNQSEETQVSRKSLPVLKLVKDITEDLSLLSEQNGIVLNVTGNLPEKEIQVDTSVLYRILENVINNALRYARREICLEFSLADANFFVTVTDDGEGFPQEILDKGGKKRLIACKDGHMGIGLSISRLLCQKHGGTMELLNTPGGACVKISLSV